MKTSAKFSILLLLVAAAASASSMCTSFTTLDQYLNAGFQCQVDNFIFSNFGYSGSMTGNPADNIGPPLNPAEGNCVDLGGTDPNAPCYVVPTQVRVVADQGGRTGSLTFLAVWEISGPDTDPSGGPPPGPADGSTGPAFESLSLSFDVTPVLGHALNHVLSQNQGSFMAGHSDLQQSATCTFPCSVTPSNWANSEQPTNFPGIGTFHVSNDFRFISNDDSGDSHLSVITDAFLENSLILGVPEPGSMLLAFGGFAALLGFRRIHKA